MRRTYMALLTQFAQQGYRKTSMAVLAQSIEVSRQTLYNRFANKEAALNWAVSCMVTDLRLDALSCLADEQRPVATVLLDAFCQWLSPIVGLLLSGPYGREYLGYGASFGGHQAKDPLDGFIAELSRYLRRRGVCTSPRQARELAFLLVMAGKGLMLTSTSQEGFRKDMAQAIRGAGIEGR